MVWQKPVFRMQINLWRGSLLPLGREAAPNPLPRCVRQIVAAGFATAAQSNGSKLPRHRVHVA
ncbi:hypothetical protein C1X35_10995 [Pseudomonas sp. FW306-1C-G01A]|nr:hypothetical protein DJ564_08960 [Pseudomonas sp. 31-12]MBA4360201.1 hypothetical protein [Pseudomonas sp.]MSU96694.1 hypothetical protein [Pseudomonas mandelii]PMV86448.1 hypothetical protein C1X56_15565 [Pseudomonas sp. GW101-1A09]PMV91350.1 hypothetical protein C1X55_30960 [Pseudomonas sp. GW460-C8]PMV97599.1 hypothetical protein C1X51_05055 [Pseudomonas sp. FW306-2-2C-B10A]PMW04950.1 hypothetical protein C1X50_15865 [Pseudomonas sp. MPR-TSA4]PMW10152.1 hypothetical protein C1X40_31670